jgi:hypothetical protein
MAVTLGGGTEHFPRIITVVALVYEGERDLYLKGQDRSGSITPFIRIKKSER